MVWTVLSLNLRSCSSSSSERSLWVMSLRMPMMPADRAVGPLIGRLDEDDVVLAVPGLERGLVDLVAGLGEEGLVVFLVLVDDLRGATSPMVLPMRSFLERPRSFSKAGVGAPVTPFGVLEEGRIGHDVDHELDELVHVPVRLVPPGPLGGVLGGQASVARTGRGGRRR